MKYLSALILLTFFLVSCNSETKPAETTQTTEATDHSKTVRVAAEEMGKFLMAKDYKSFARFTYPKVAEMMGGKDKMVEILENTMGEMEATGISFINVAIGEPSKCITAGNELQCTIPQTIEMKMPDGKMTTTSTLIAVSSDNGKTWCFIDTSGKDIKAMRALLPNLSENLVIAARTEPTYSKE
jgi:PBP1b-binding outer membrane lipoprotein LpoB